MRCNIRAVIAGLVCVAAAGVVRAGPITFVNDYEGFLAAAGEVQTIDFETLPDGSTPVELIENTITPEFNYTDQGVSFSSFQDKLFVQGSPSTSYRLEASSYPDIELRNWIIADFVMPSWAVGAFFSGSATLYAYDTAGDLIGSIFAGGGGRDQFAGVVSDDSIAFAVLDRASYFSVADSFHFTPVPEPASLLLTGIGVVVLLHRSRRHS